MITLPTPRQTSDVPLEKAIFERRSIRDFTKDGISLEQLSQLLWAGQGITNDEEGLRASPSAGGVFPMTLWVLADRVDGLDSGWLYVYEPDEHALREKRKPKTDKSLAAYCFNQEWMDTAAVTIFITSTSSKMRKQYGDDSEQYIQQEAGHIAQNILLQATALGLGGTPIGAYEYDDIRKFLGTPQHPDYIISLGCPA